MLPADRCRCERQEKVEEKRKNVIFDGQGAHLAVVVEDIDKALTEYCRIFQLNIPPVKQTGEPKEAKVIYRGKPTPARAKQAFLQLGDLRLELLEPDEYDSTWREYLDKNGNCVHHVAFYVNDMTEALSKLREEGIEPVQTGYYKGGHYAYVESEKNMAMMLELLQND